VDVRVGVAYLRKIVGGLWSLKWTWTWKTFFGSIDRY